MEQDVSKNRAWLLDFGKGLKAAVGVHEVSQVLLSAELFEVPCAPLYCNEVMVFRKRILPVLDVVSFLEGKKLLYTQSEIIGIAVYQESFNHPLSHVGLHLATLPVGILVGDDQACELPREQQFWLPFIHACFFYEGQFIPVLNLRALFCR